MGSRIVTSGKTFTLLLVGRFAHITHVHDMLTSATLHCNVRDITLHCNVQDTQCDYYNAGTPMLVLP